MTAAKLWKNNRGMREHFALHFELKSKHCGCHVGGRFKLRPDKGNYMTSKLMLKLTAYCLSYFVQETNFR